MFKFFWKKKKNNTTPQESQTPVEQSGTEDLPPPEAPSAAEATIEAPAAEINIVQETVAEPITSEPIKSELIESKPTAPEAIEPKRIEKPKEYVQEMPVQAVESVEVVASIEPVEPEQAAQTEQSIPQPPSTEPTAEPAEERKGWFKRLTSGLKKTGQSITQVFTGAKIDDDLYDDLEAALLMADAGTSATQYLLDKVKEKVKQTKATEASSVRGFLEDALTELLTPLEAPLSIGEHQPTVVMVAGVNGAGKTTSIGKLTRHLAKANCKTLLAAADTFRAAAREQLEVWADRNMVEIISQQSGDPASVAYDAVSAGKARKVDVVLVDTAGRLATQLHLMDELKKVHRVTGKAMEGAPHEVILVVDGNTGQNALNQVKAFDSAINLTGLIVTKLDGTAKGGVIAAIALWSQEREKEGKPAVPVYFIGVGEQLEDLQTFDAKEFAHALLGE